MNTVNAFMVVVVVWVHPYLKPELSPAVSNHLLFIMDGWSQEGIDWADPTISLLLFSTIHLLHPLAIIGSSYQIIPLSF